MTKREMEAQLAQLLALVQTVPIVNAPAATPLPAWVTEAKALAPKPSSTSSTKAPAAAASYKAERSEFNGIPGYTVRKMFGANIARQKFLTDKEVSAILAVVTK